MKKYLITIHSEDTQCIIIAEDEDDANDKFSNGQIDEWLTAEFEQPDFDIEEIEDNN